MLYENQPLIPEKAAPERSRVGLRKVDSIDRKLFFSEKKVRDRMG
jgi:hypothetical protein